MLIASICDKSYMMEIILIIKTIFKLACLLAPLIIIIISTIGIFKIILSGKEDDLKDYFKLTVKRLIAGLVVFFIPAIISYAVNSLADKNIDFITCFETATKEKVESLKAKEKAEEEAEQNQKEKEDEKALREAYEKDQKDRNKQKKTFEEWKKEREQNNNSMNLTGNEWTNKLLSEAKSITDYIRENNFNYGDAPINPAINHDAKLASCDRCVAWFLYNVGYTNQPEAHGVVVSQFPAWCEQNGFKKITNINDLKAGDVVFTNPDANGSPGHVFLLGNPLGNGLWERYDCGSVYRIRLTNQYSNYKSQPFHEGIGNFMYAYRSPNAQ